MTETARPDVARWIALVLLQLNIGIHVALTPMHLEEKFYIGVLFTIGNTALFAAMLLLVSERLRAIGWLLGTATSVAEFAGFILSRTVGLPQGYKEAWATAPEDYLGLVCLVLEVAFVALALRKSIAGSALPVDRDATKTTATAHRVRVEKAA